jgi:hypothetical protein
MSCLVLSVLYSCIYHLPVMNSSNPFASLPSQSATSAALHQAVVDMYKYVMCVCVCVCVCVCCIVSYLLHIIPSSLCLYICLYISVSYTLQSLESIRYHRKKHKLDPTAAQRFRSKKKKRQAARKKKRGVDFQDRLATRTARATAKSMRKRGKKGKKRQPRDDLFD